MMEIAETETDVLVLGGGLAGYQAAISATKAGARVTMAYRARGASPFVIAWNVPIAHSDERDSSEAYFNDMVQGGYKLNDRRLVEALSIQSIEIFHELVGLGVPFEQKEGRYLQRHLSGNTYPRSVYVAKGTGPILLQRLKELVAELPIQTMEGWIVISLLRDGDDVAGALLFNPRTEKLTAVRARSVVMAMGGLGRHYEDSTYPVDIGADSYALAFNAGATMIDMEFIQFEPVIIIHPEKCAGMEMPTAMLGDGAHLLNAQGERFMFRYNPVHGEKQMEKAKLALCIQQEIDEGRGLPDGSILFDARPLSSEALESYITHCKRLRSAGMDPAKEMPHVKPAAHSTMGGIQIDQSGWTGVPGLYAGGEAAGGLHGASRLAGNGGSDAIVFGALAGRGAASGLLSAKARNWNDIIKASVDPIFGDTSRRSDRPDPDSIKAGVRKIMGQAAGLYRNGSDLAKAQADLKVLNSELKDGLRIGGIKDAVKASEARHMVVTASMVVESCLARTESRGAHQRTDYPQTDEANWNQHVSIIKGAGGELSIGRSAIR